MTLLLTLALAVLVPRQVAPEVAESARHLLVTWRDAWERRDLRLFMACYAEDFSSGGLDRAALEQQKEAAFARAAWIRVAIQDVVVEPADDGLVMLRFEQSYESEGYGDRGIKTLWLGERDGRWLIVSDRFEPFEG